MNLQWKRIVLAIEVLVLFGSVPLFIVFGTGIIHPTMLILPLLLVISLLLRFTTPFRFRNCSPVRSTESAYCVMGCSSC